MERSSRCNEDACEMGKEMSPLKGLFKVKKALADRSTRFYCYAWRGGPAAGHS